MNLSYIIACVRAGLTAEKTFQRTGATPDLSITPQPSHLRDLKKAYFFTIIGIFIQRVNHLEKDPLKKLRIPEFDNWIGGSHIQYSISSSDEQVRFVLLLHNDGKREVVCVTELSTRWQEILRGIVKEYGDKANMTESDVLEDVV